MNTPQFPERLYCVVGWPLSQTLSPLLHNTGFMVHHIPAVYLKFPLPPESLPAFVQSVRTLPIAGCSITIPHKTPILPLLDRCTPRAQAIGAVNTLFWDKGTLVGDNTDCAGFLAPLTNIPVQNMRVLVLGAGGAARAILQGLVERKAAHIDLTTPSNKRHIALADEFGAHPLPWEARHTIAADMVVNTTPVGMHGSLVDQSPYDMTEASHLPSIAYDIVYNPLETRFVREAKQHGIATISGRTMFFEQGNAQFNLWTGKNLPPLAKTALDDALNAQP